MISSYLSLVSSCSCRETNKRRYVDISREIGDESLLNVDGLAGTGRPDKQQRSTYTRHKPAALVFTVVPFHHTRYPIQSKISISIYLLNKMTDRPLTLTCMKYM